MYILPCTGTKTLKKLFQVYLDSNEDWLSSKLVMEAEQKARTTRLGLRGYTTYKDLKTEHGKTLADQLVQEKKTQQQIKGDYLPGTPHWQVHPDFPREEDCVVHVPRPATEAL